MRGRITIILIILSLTVLLSACQSTDDAITRDDIQVSALIINPVSDTYPSSVSDWTRLVQSEHPGAHITSLSGQDINPSDIINAIVEMRGDLCILIYHGHGGEGFAELGENRTIAYSDMVNNLVLKGCRFVFIVDACHAASAVEAFKDMSADADSLLIASSGTQEESYGSVLPTASERSVSWLLKSLQQYGSVPESITKNDVTQHPEVWFFNARTKAVERSTEFNAFPFLPGVPSV